MSNAFLQCVRCRSEYALEPLFYGCPACLDQGRTAPLEVAYRRLPTRLQRSGETGVWAWSEWLPDIAESAKTTLHEGSTALLAFEQHADSQPILMKNETVNPTWSWKDRPNSVSVSIAKHWGFRKVLAISTGNHGNSAAAYSSRAGLESLIFCHRDVPPLQMALMQAYGARVVLGGDREKLARQALQDDSVFPATIYCPRSGFANPFGVEGFKTIAFEIVAALGHAPPAVFVPVGSGDGVYGIWKGFRELKAAGIIDRLPRIIGCQSTGADSAYRAFHAGQRHVDALAEVTTIALSIGELATGDHAVRAARESNGTFAEVTDTAILAAAKLSGRQGLAIESASAAALACALSGVVPPTGRDPWVVIASGSAVKWPEEITSQYPAPSPEIEDKPIQV